ncbi:MAG: hypothetical protein GC204_19635 [Chloroflexi bacterium]|nr:hypothetical protein [Chloroflexota bacterium]
MGYTTEFEGRFTLDKPLRPRQMEYLEVFSDIDHVKFRTDGLAKLPDPLRRSVRLPVGDEGAYFVGISPEHDAFVVDRFHPPHGMPNSKCGWRPTRDGRGIEWNGREKFYDYVEWLTYLIEHFLKRWGYTLNGEVTWVGEDPTDTGVIVVCDNEVNTRSPANLPQ